MTMLASRPAEALLLSLLILICNLGSRPSLAMQAARPAQQHAEQLEQRERLTEQADAEQPGEAGRQRRGSASPADMSAADHAAAGDAAEVGKVGTTSGGTVVIRLEKGDVEVNVHVSCLLLAMNTEEDDSISEEAQASVSVETPRGS